MLLLTGAAGFIGSNVLRALNSRGITDIICVDSLSSAQSGLNLTGTFFADYLDCDELFLNRLPPLSRIIHLGATSATGAEDVKDVVENNFTYAKKIIRLADNHNCPIVYASSAAVYGTNPECEEKPECENPKSPYALSKWLLDQYVRNNMSRIRVPIFGLRYFNVYGPGENHKEKYVSFIRKIFMAVVTGNKIRIFDHPNGLTSAQIMRDFIHVQDAADATLFFIQSTGAKPGIYNVGTGVANSFDTVLNTALSVIADAGYKIPQIIRRTMNSGFAARYQTYTRANTDKTRAVGWTQTCLNLQQGITKYWDNFVKEL